MARRTARTRETQRKVTLRMTEKQPKPQSSKPWSGRAPTRVNLCCEIVFGGVLDFHGGLRSVTHRNLPRPWRIFSRLFFQITALQPTAFPL